MLVARRAAALAATATRRGAQRAAYAAAPAATRSAGAAPAVAGPVARRQRACAALASARCTGAYAAAAHARRALATATPAAAAAPDAKHDADVDGSGDAPQPPTAFAVIRLAGFQYKVVEGDLVTTSRLLEREVGDEFAVDDVLLGGTATASVVGTPLVPRERCEVRAVVESHAKMPKVIVFKKKRRKGYQRWQGHRQPVSVVRIVSVDVRPDAGATPSPSSS